MKTKRRERTETSKSHLPKGQRTVCDNWMAFSILSRMGCEQKKGEIQKIPSGRTVYFDFDRCPGSERSAPDVTKIRQAGGKNS